MVRNSVLPALTAGLVVLALSACQGTGGQSGSTGTASSAPAAAPAATQQAVAPDLVRNVQRSLGARGYDAGPADGVYGTATVQAMRKFQNDQKLAATGQIDTQSLAALGLTGTATTGSAATNPREYTPTSKRGAMAEPSANRVASAKPELRQMQQQLSDRGYAVGPVDGLMGPQTQQALRDFQRDENLPASGRPDQPTMAALGMERGGVQTGQMPAEPAREPAVDVPPTGSQAPGSAPETTRNPDSLGEDSTDR